MWLEGMFCPHIVKTARLQSRCLSDKGNILKELPSETSKEWELGGLLYSSESFYELVNALKNKPNRAFSLTH